MSESYEDRLARLRLMGSPTDTKWDLSDNDRAAIRWVVAAAAPHAGEFCFLMLNDMRSGHFEDLTAVALASTRDALERFIERETVAPYVTHGRWHKIFREGGPLEWFNPPMLSVEHFVIGPRYIDRGRGLFDVDAGRVAKP